MKSRAPKRRPARNARGVRRRGPSSVPPLREGEATRQLLSAFYILLARASFAEETCREMALARGGPIPDEFAAMRGAIDEALRGLLAIDSEKSRNPLHDAAVVVRDFCEAIPQWDARGSAAPIVPAFVIAGDMLPGVVGLYFSGGPPPPDVDPEELRRLAEAIARILEEILDAVRGGGGDRGTIIQLQRLLDALRAGIRYWFDSGRPINPQEILDSLKWMILEILRVLREQSFSLRTYLVAIATAIGRFLASVGRGIVAILGSEVGLCLLAFAIGCGIGALIGSSKINGTTVWERIAEGMYQWWYVGFGGLSCDEIWRMYVDAANRRRAYEATPNPDRGMLKLLLTLELIPLQKYLELGCPDQGGVVRREIARLRARIAAL